MSRPHPRSSRRAPAAAHRRIRERSRQRHEERHRQSRGDEHRARERRRPAQHGLGEKRQQKDRQIIRHAEDSAQADRDRKRAVRGTARSIIGCAARSSRQMKRTNASPADANELRTHGSSQPIRLPCVSGIKNAASAAVSSANPQVSKGARPIAVCRRAGALQGKHKTGDAERDAQKKSAANRRGCR